MPKRVFLPLIIVIFLSVSAAHATSACDLTALPPDLQEKLRAEFSAWKVQDTANLAKSAKDHWQSEKPLSCPGIAIGKFEGPTRTSYALLLVPLSNSDSAYRLLVFTPNEAQGALMIVESSDVPGAANGFVRTVALTKVFSADWRRKLNTASPEGILFVDAGTSEYEADVYFWSDGKYRHEPIDE